MEKHIQGIQNNLKDSSILIVERLDKKKHSIVNILKSAGYKNIVTAHTYQETFQKLEEFVPELIILDVVDHGFNSHQICLGLKSNLKFKNIPVIAHIDPKSVKNRKEALELGIDDFIGTPLFSQEVITKVKIHISQSKILNKLIDFQHRLNYELEEARKMLFSLISKDNLNDDISNKYNISISSYYKTSEELGGDYYAIKEVDDGVIASYVWDFSGHGISAAINTFRLHSLLQSIIETKLNPAAFLNQINSYLYTMLGKDQFATMFYNIIDLKVQKITYAASGTPYPYLISFKNAKIKRLDSAGFPLGTTQNAQYKNHVVNLKNWDALLFYSDALIETQNLMGEFLDLEGLLEELLVESKSAVPSNLSEWLFEHLIETFTQFYGDNLKDDLTICMISKNN